MSRVTSQSLGQSQPSYPPFSPHRRLGAASWAQIHQQLQDFSRGTQVVSGQGLTRGPYSHSILAHDLCPPPPCQAELEQERAQLLVRATMAEEQLSELQEYVDQHLGRWVVGKVGLVLVPNIRGRAHPWPER